MQKAVLVGIILFLCLFSKLVQFLENDMRWGLMGAVLFLFFFFLSALKRFFFVLGLLSIFAKFDHFSPNLPCFSSFFSSKQLFFFCFTPSVF